MELKFTFNDGGHDLFREKFQTMKERLEYAGQLQRETGQVIPTTEDLPRYEPEAPAGSAVGGTSGSGGSSTLPQATAQNDQPSHALPEDPPPDYEEAQAQAVGIRLEEQMRGEAERESRSP
jgi:WW domain-binding protein 2